MKSITTFLPIDLAQEIGIPIVATNDVKFLTPIDPDDESPSDFEAHEARVCIQKGESYQTLPELKSM